MPNRRTGKIARLPKVIRDQVNVMIRDGVKYPAIIAFLEAEGHPGILEQNLTNWVQTSDSNESSGYLDWQREQERLEDMKAKRELALEIVQQNEGSRLHEATLHLAASQLYEVLVDFDLVNLKALLADKPENYAQVVNSLAKLSKGALDIQRYKDHVQAQKEKIQAALNQAKTGGVTAETLAKIEQEVGFL
ncbi:MAG: hypothetical protein SFY81_04895 [Verrucomicrobiota bacterium]|nr:hypothetical protein [Verrucomicrobiota bacterium]